MKVILVDKKMVRDVQNRTFRLSEERSREIMKENEISVRYRSRNPFKIIGLLVEVDSVEIRIDGVDEPRRLTEAESVRANHCIPYDEDPMGYGDEPRY